MPFRGFRAAGLIGIWTEFCLIPKKCKYLSNYAVRHPPMTIQKPFRFWALKPDGERAFQAYEHINAYYEGCLEQYARIYDLWNKSSAIKADSADSQAFSEKRRAMQQVVRDIHYLLISLQVIWKTMQRLCNSSLYPNFAGLVPLRKKWEPYFAQYREPRNTLEHYDDQVLGLDSKQNSPGYGVRLTSDGAFALGAQGEVRLDQKAQEQLTEFASEFWACIDTIVGQDA